MKKALFRLLYLMLFTTIFFTGCGKQDNKNTTVPTKGVTAGSKEPVSTPDDAELPASGKHDTAPAIIENDVIPDSGIDVKIEDPAVNEWLKKLTIEQKVAQMFMITPEQLTKVDVATASGQLTRNAFANTPVGGIVYMGQNIENAAQFKEMVTTMQQISKTMLGLPVFLSVDEEGGSVVRLAGAKLGIEDVGNMSDIGATGDSNKAYEAGQKVGKYLSEYGINVDLAPVADVITNEANEVVKLRSFGSDASLVAEMANAFANGLAENYVYATYKHFPGHGASAEDSHEELAVSQSTLDPEKSAELIPFARAISAGAKFIMVGHIAVPNYTGDNTPATLSEKVINGLLREQMGYDGIVITDAMGMKAITDNYTVQEAAVKAVNAGADILLLGDHFTEYYNALLNAVKDGTVSEERINESVERILKVKLAMN